MRPYEPYIPKNNQELIDLLGWMILNAPKFEDKSGYFSGQNIDTEFFALKEGLKAIRHRIGEENYQKLIALSDRARTHFEADPEDKTEDGIKGRDCIMAMQDILKSSSRLKRR